MLTWGLIISYLIFFLIQNVWEDSREDFTVYSIIGDVFIWL